MPEDPEVQRFANDLTALAAAARETPDPARQAKVAELKRKLRSGMLQTDASQLAKKIVSDHLLPEGE